MGWFRGFRDPLKSYLRILKVVTRKILTQSGRQIWGRICIGGTYNWWEGLLYQPSWRFEVDVDVWRSYFQIWSVSPSLISNSTFWSVLVLHHPNFILQLGHDPRFHDHMWIPWCSSLLKCVLLSFYFDTTQWQRLDHVLAIFPSLTKPEDIYIAWGVLSSYQAILLQSVWSSQYDFVLGELGRRT